MSRNGALCLKKIIVSYSPTGGSPGVRQFLATHLPQFKGKYPTVEIDLRPRKWPEQAITGVYRDGSERSYNIRLLSAMAIWLRCNKLVNEANDYDVPFSSRHIYFQRKSVQGTWNPWLWMGERECARKPPVRWDRKLSEKEWQYYVDKYSAQMKLEEETVAAQVERRSELPAAYTKEVAERWKAHVAPRLQTDVEHNIAQFKANFKKGVKQPPVRMGEYKLFSVPDHAELGQDAVRMLRRREAENVEDWWLKRKEQLKPPK